MKSMLSASSSPKFSVYRDQVLQNVMPSWCSHENAEILLIESGNFTLYVGNELQTGGPGSLIVIPPNRLHKISTTTDSDVCFLCLNIQSDIAAFMHTADGISPLDFLSASFTHPVVQMEKSQLQWVTSLFYRLMHEKEEYVPVSLLCCCSLLELLLSEITRIYNEFPIETSEQLDDKYAQPDISRIIKNVIQYINANYRKDITLSTLAQEFWLNPSYLSRQFKINVGMTLTEFITNLRIYSAKVALLTTNKSISEIALDSGFNSIPYFTLVFKNSEGMSPKQFRKEHQQLASPFKVPSSPPEK